MFERERSDTDAIEFDFFDDAPSSDVEKETAPPKRRRRIPTRPPGSGSPLVRLGGLAAAVLVLAVVLILWAKSCGEDKRGEYQDYMQSVAQVSGESARIGTRLNRVIFASGIKLGDLRNELDGLRRQQAQTVSRAQELQPPGTLREQQESLVEALQLRVSGLNGLAGAFGQIAQTRNARVAGRLLAEQAYRLLAGDILYDDFFKAGAQGVLEREGVTGVPVPDSNFVTNAELTSARSWRLIVRRLTQEPTAGGLHGNQIDGVRVVPGGKRLSPTDENTIVTSDRLAFEVLVKNSGESQETQVKVNLTIQQSPQSIDKEQVIASINPGETKTVVFRSLGVIDFAQPTILKVTVAPVTGEKNTNNNTAEYRVIFSLP